MARLVLVGLPGVGKTSVARLLAEKWDCLCVDTDDLVAERVGCSAAQFLRSEGEPAFRREECAALNRALDIDAVVATGGGIVTTDKVRERLKGELVVWLDCVDELILERLIDADRPLLAGGADLALAQLRNERQALYEGVSLLRIDASGTLDDVVSRLIQQVSKVTR